MPGSKKPIDAAALLANTTGLLAIKGPVGDPRRIEKRTA